MTNFSNRLRKLKRQRGVTAKEIAAACQVSMQTVYGWLKDTMPKNNNLLSLSAYFGVSPDWLANGETSPARTAMVHELTTLLPQLSDQQLHATVVLWRTFLLPAPDNKP